MIRAFATTQSIGQLLTVLLIFAFVLVITYLTSRFIGNYQKEKLSGENICVIETQRISPNKYVQIVKIGNKYFAIANCKDTVTMLSEIPEDSLNLFEASKEKLSFKDFLKKAREEDKEDN